MNLFLFTGNFGSNKNEGIRALISRGVAATLKMIAWQNGCIAEVNATGAATAALKSIAKQNILISDFPSILFQ